MIGINFFKKVSQYFFIVKDLKFIQIIFQIRSYFPKRNPKKISKIYSLKVNKPIIESFKKNNFFKDENLGFEELFFKEMFKNDLLIEAELKQKDDLYKYEFYSYLFILNNQFLDNKELNTKIETLLVQNERDDFFWDTWPSSRRSISLIYFLSLTDKNNDYLIKEIYRTIDHVYSNLEYRLLGNHLITNIKCLIYGGVFFNTKKSKRWLKKGLSLLTRELDRQILEDGGHFEQSTMYHRIVLKELLDILFAIKSYNSIRNSEEIPLDSLVTKIEKMLMFANILHTHCESGDYFPNFNDSNYSYGPDINNLYKYSRFLNISYATDEKNTYDAQYLEPSGFIVFKTEAYKLIIFAREVKAKYIPGHTHDNNFTFELYSNKCPIIVNPGISTYHDIPKRIEERSSANQNTLSIIGIDGDEVVSKFRVARKLKLIDVQISNLSSHTEVTLIKKGLRNVSNSIHIRKFLLYPKHIQIEDSLVPKIEMFRVYFHLHPMNKLIHNHNRNKIIINGSDEIQFSSGSIELKNNYFNMGFYKSIKTKTILQSVRSDTGMVTINFHENTINN